MSKKFSLASYRKRKERTHSTEDIVQGFDDFMKSPDVPAATQPQDGLTFLPPMPKKAKIPTHPEIDLTTEPDTATEQPLPVPPPGVLPPRPPTTSNSISDVPGKMSDTHYFTDYLHQARNQLDSSVSSPPITTQGYTRSVANDKLMRAPIKSQRHSLQSNNRDHQTGAPTKSKSLQSSSLMSRTERSYAPSMSSSLPQIQNRPPSVSVSPPAKKTNLGNCRSDVKKLPYGPMRAPGSLLADAYSPSGCHSSSTKPKASSSGQNSHDGGRRGNGCQRNSLGDKKSEPVVVIDVDDGEQAHDSSRHQTKPSEASREWRKTQLGASEQVADGCHEGQSSVEHQNQSKGEQRRTDSNSSSLKESIPSLQDLKAQAPPRTNSPLKLKKSQESQRPGYIEKEDTKMVLITGQSTAAVPRGTCVSTGEPSGSTGDETGDAQRHTVASSSTESDDSVLCMGTTSSYFPSTKRGSEVAPVAKEVWPSCTVTPPTDILARIEPTQRVGAKPQDKNSSQMNFVPRCKDHSPENDHSNVVNLPQLAPKQHHNRFAKNQSSSTISKSVTSHTSKDTGVLEESKSSEHSGKTKPRLPEGTLNKTPTLSMRGFSFSIVEEKPAASGRESKAGKKSTKNDEVIFQAEEFHNKQYNMRNRSRHVRSSEIDDGSSSEDDDFESPASRKTTAPDKNTKSFYGVLLKVAEDNNREDMLKFNKTKAAGAGTSRKRGSKQSAKETGNWKNVGAVWKGHGVKSLRVGRIPKRQQTTLTAADDDETTLALCMVQIGRLICEAAFNLEIKSKELHFQFECKGKVHRQIIELKHVISWKMNLGDGPKFVAIEVDLSATNKLKSILVSKFHLNNDFFKQGGRDPSQHYIIFRLGTGDDIYPQQVANINEVLDGINGLTLNYCDVCRDVSPKEATEFLESVKPTESAMSTVPLMSSKDISGLSLADRDATDDAATITDQSGRAPRKQLHPVRRSTRQRRPPRSTCSTSLMSIDDSENDSQEEPIVRRPKTPNVKLLTYKPQGSKVTLDIMSADVECLDPGEYLNDKIIDFYLNYLLYEKLSEEFRSRVHIFSTFFYTRLSNASMDDKASNCSTPEKLHSRVKTWTRRVDLFLKDYIILPVCDRAHWYVVIVCYPGRFDPSKIKPPQPRKRNTRSRSGRKSMRLQKRKGLSTASDEIGMEECVEKEGSPSEQQGGLNDSLEKKEAATDEADVEDMGEAKFNIFNLPAIAEVRSGVSMSPEHLHQTPMLLDTTEDGESFKGECDMENGKGEEESPFSQLALAEVIPETPPMSSQEGERNEGEKERDRGGSVTPTPVTLSPGILDSSAAAHNDVDTMSIGGSTCNEDTVLYDPTTNEEAEQQTTTTLNSEVAPSAMTGCLHPETGQVESTASTSRDDDKGEPLEDEVIDESGGGEKEDTTLVDNVEVKEEPLEEEDLEPQKRPCIQILDSLGIKRPSTARRIRNYLTMEWKSKKVDELSFEYLPVNYPPIPLQDNSSDCGIFVLEFIESLLGTIQRESPPPSVAEEWASYDKTRAKRKALCELITSLQQRDKAS